MLEQKIDQARSQTFLRGEFDRVTIGAEGWVVIGAEWDGVWGGGVPLSTGEGSGEGAVPLPRKCWNVSLEMARFGAYSVVYLTEMLGNLLLGPQQLHVYMYCWWLRGVQSNQSNPPRYRPVDDSHLMDNEWSWDIYTVLAQCTNTVVWQITGKCLAEDRWHSCFTAHTTLSYHRKHLSKQDNKFTQCSVDIPSLSVYSCVGGSWSGV